MNNYELTEALENNTLEGISSGDVKQWEFLSRKDKKRCLDVNRKVNSMKEKELDERLKGIVTELYKNCKSSTGSKYPTYFRFLYVPEPFIPIFESLYPVFS